MKHYLFTDKDTGEEFLVCDDTLLAAMDTALSVFPMAVFVCKLTDFEAEMSGLDEY